MSRPKGALFFLVIFCVAAMSPGVRADGYDAFKGLEGTLKISGGTAHIPVMQELARES